MAEEQKEKAIVLKVSDYGENDKLVTLFSLESGKVTARMRGVKKRGAKLASFAQVFCFAEFILVKRGNFYTVINASPIDNFFGLAMDLNKYYAGAVLLESVEILSRQDEPNAELFVLALNALKTLAYNDASVMLVISKFLLEAMQISGYKIETHKCAECGKKTDSKIFSFDSGGFICEEHESHDTTILSDSAIKLLKMLQDSDFDNLEKDALGSKNVMKLLGYYFEAKTESKLTALKAFL